ncbi:hypothetical protein BP6252_05394 [Coleophoma cylindrospora]|uniref:Nucleoporin NSP1 n=1 Tax=Coleophoma cylindrospora TaxID=1849047 RepID=A0A3D8RU68_9HELO|nr:hypothetical protein BP6252_05394 [Coleophoma cylindrospora]
MAFSFGQSGSGNGGASTPFGSTGNTGSIFGQTPASSAPASSGSIFGQPAASTATAPATTGGLFGGAKPAAPASGGLFGGGATPTATSTASGSSLFGGSKPAAPAGDATKASAPSLFGSAGSAPSGGLFGGGAAAPSSGAPAPSLFGAPVTSPGSASSIVSPFSFGPKKDESGSAAAKPAENKPSLFGNLGSSSATTSAPFGSTTPAPSKLSFGTSTTPAGPPPAEAPKSLFGTSTQPPAAGGLFSQAKPAEPASKPSTSGLFSGASNPPASGGLFGGAKPAAPASGGLFGNTAPASSATTTPASAAAPASTPATSLFGAKPAAPAATTAAPSTSLFGGAKPAASSATPTAPAATTSLFGSKPGGVTNTTGASTPASNTGTTSAPPASGLFGGLGAASSATPASTSTPSTAAPAPAPASSLFGGAAATPKPTDKTTAPASSATTAPAATNPQLGASTAGPQPQLSRLKNKTMDEIITRWASDLSKYQKEFQEQAGTVAQWDRLLVENGEKIQQLYNKAFEAEKTSTEVERQLASVESQQNELAEWLDRYEQDVDDIFEQRVGASESLQGPDQEREKTYKLAEKLTDRLDDMGKNLSGMIEAVNEASSTLNKSSKTDDPLSSIVRVLNQHLQQLQWIDQNATALQKKVAAAQQMGQSMGSSGFQQENEADNFYRSYMSRR